MEQPEVIQFRPQGVCCQLMQLAIQDGKIIDADFFGGCSGNLRGIKQLIKGMSVDEVIERLKGIPCGDKPTSCPDQLSRCLVQYKAQSSSAV